MANLSTSCCFALVGIEPKAFPARSTRREGISPAHKRRQTIVSSGIDGGLTCLADDRSSREMKDDNCTSYQMSTTTFCAALNRQTVQRIRGHRQENELTSTTMTTSFIIDNCYRRSRLSINCRRGQVSSCPRARAASVLLRLHFSCTLKPLGLSFSRR